MPAFASPPALLEPLRELGVAWMNRGHALMQQGDQAGLVSALAAYAEAVTVLHQLPVGENPAWANSLGAALMNRGQLLHRVHGTARATEALAAFDEAIVILRPHVSSSDLRSPDSALRSPWPRRNLTGTLVNRANLLLDLARFPAAAEVAREALALTAPHERAEVVDADLALKARRALCDAIGRLIVEAGADQGSLATEASDLVDDALAVIRHWSGRGEPAFAPLALRFFRYGTRLYRLHQPHFLAEFIRENLPAAAGEFQAVACEAVDSALADELRNGEFLTVGDTATERRLRTWHDLSALRGRLAPPTPAG